MGSRHRSRELAIQMSYQWDLNPQTLSEDAAIARFWREQALSPDENREFFEYLVRGVAAYLPAIDRKIEDTLKNWKMSRVEKVDLAILRVAVFELLHGDKDKPDAPVVINEAVEIAKKFGNRGSAHFVNGVLDAISKGRTTEA